MNTKNLITTCLVGCMVTSCSAQLAPKWKMTLRVLDENDQPVADADAEIWYYGKPPPGASIGTEKKAGRTDTNGLFTASGRSVFMLHGSAIKDGYYRTTRNYELGAAYQYDPVKWSPTVTLVLKKIGKPIAMYAKQILSGPPVLHAPVGFDLTTGDWVAPHGKGLKADVLFAKDYAERAPNDYFSEITVSFPNPGDGIQEFRVPYPPGEGSQLRSPHEAPEGGYGPGWSQVISARPGQPSRFDYDAKRNFFLRVRTVLDEKGNVKSAHYGKIYGDFMQFRYYLNPTPNDRNVEFDPKQNLLQGLESFEQVREP